jgi:hypothetical protein
MCGGVKFPEQLGFGPSDQAHAVQRRRIRNVGFRDELGSRFTATPKEDQ